jgi:hypothetical protein
MDYTSFAEKCVQELKILQDKFQEDYGVDWYDNWYYNQATGLLTFSSGDTQLNFKYFAVGSFSQKSKTWKWSWDNDHTLDNVKSATEEIKEFGHKSNFPKLTTGCFPSDEYEAWEFTAIAAKLTTAIGVYRPVNDEGLQIYLAVTEFVENEIAQNIKDKFVECSTHEFRRRAFVCQHLNHTTKVGFEEAFETVEDMELSDEDDFQAWCNDCEAVRQKKGEWNDQSMAFAKIKVICERCYFEMKELNLGHR